MLMELNKLREGTLSPPGLLKLQLYLRYRLQFNKIADRGQQIPSGLTKPINCCRRKLSESSGCDRVRQLIGALIKCLN